MQDRAAKKAAIEQVKQKKLQQTQAINKELKLRETLSKATGLSVPQDPEKLANWRDKVLKKIQDKFYLSGDTAKDIELMTSYGMSPDLAKTILRPMTDAQKSAVYDIMASQTQGGVAKYSDNDLKLLKMSEEEIVKQRATATEQYGGERQSLAIKNESRRQKLERAREKEFGKAVKQMGRFNALAQKGMSGSPGQQRAIQSNLFKKLSKAGYIDPSLSAEENTQKLSALNMGQTASFLYPNQAGGMLAMKKSRGGIIYAAKGQLINFQPQGTDTVPAMLTPGEFVVNAKATQAHLPLLKAINKQRGGHIGYYDAGGTVESSLLRNQQSVANVSNRQDQTLRSIYSQTNSINRKTSSIDNSNSAIEQNIQENYNSTNKDLGRLQSTAAKTLDSSESTRMDLQNTGYINRFNKGGVVYAANGMLIPYQPKGTDTVPAMLTPGEFVINRNATAKNLPLLQAINNGGTSFMARGGQVNYMAGGGLLGQILTPMFNSFVLLNESIKQSIKALQDYQRQLASTQPNSVSTNGGAGQLAGLDGLGQFVVKFDQFIAAVNAINLPPVISLQVAPIQVNITGAEALTQALQGPMGEMLTKQISSAFGRLSAATEGALQVG
jgi:hypothetical protein